MDRQERTHGELVRAGVIGLGNMGRHHVRVLAELPGVDLVAVADPKKEARELVAKARRVPAYASYTDLMDSERLDAVVVAVPTAAHFEVAAEAISRRIHTLVEKPLAPTVAQATRLVDLAADAGVIATVGHIERYNPAVLKLKEFLDAGTLGSVYQLRAIRTGPLPDRVTDVGVVVDLATHELDVIRYLVGQPVESVFAECAQQIHSGYEDLATGLLRFSDGTIALLDVNWLTPIKIRELTVVGEGGMYRLDYIGQTLWFYENSHASNWSGALRRQGVSEGNTVSYPIKRIEPLHVELEAFTDAVRGIDTELVPLSDGVAAVALAEAMKLSSDTHRAIINGDLASPLTVLAGTP